MSKSASRSRSATARKARQAAQGQPGTNRNFFLVAGIGIGIVVMGAVILLASRANQPQAVQPTQQAAAPAALPDTVSIAEAAELRDSGAFILDVRTPEEWAEYHMPGSTLIPLYELESRAAEIPRDRQIVVVCRSGNRSQEGRDVLKAAGFTSVASMAGGLSEWRDQGLPTESGE
jgi:rhodanese-related sulfurtransferase